MDSTQLFTKDEKPKTIETRRNDDNAEHMIEEERVDLKLE